MVSELFLELSRALTGETDLDLQIAADYEYRLHEYFGADFERLLQEFGSHYTPENPEQAVTKILEDVPEFNTVAREIVRAWYTGQFQTPYEDTEPPQEVAHYSQGLLWRVIRAHAPGYTNAGYGAWEELPPDGI